MWYIRWAVRRLMGQLEYLIDHLVVCFGLLAPIVVAVAAVPLGQIVRMSMVRNSAGMLVVDSVDGGSAAAASRLAGKTIAENVDLSAHIDSNDGVVVAMALVVVRTLFDIYRNNHCLRMCKRVPPKLDDILA